MKTIFRFLSNGALTAAILAVGAAAGFAQSAPVNPNCADLEGHNALYTKFTGIYQSKNLPEMKTALSTGKEYLEKYGSCEAYKDQVEFVKPHVARLDTAVPAREKADALKPFFTRYDAGINSDNATEILTAGKEILNVNKDDVNIIVPMAVAASYQSTKENNYKFADEGIRYANVALSQLKSGAPLTKKDAKGTPVVGVLKYTYTKEQAINELTYALAYLNMYGKKNKQVALPLYYELSQSAISKSDPRVYGAIGDHYVEEGAPIGEEIAKLIAQQRTATDEAVKLDLDKQIKAKIALFNGYTERALDAYSRAHNVAKAGPYKDNLYKVMQGLYKRRFEKETGLDQFVSSTLAKPFPNPTTPVDPVEDPEPTTTTTTTSAPASAKPAAATTNNKPVSTAPAKATVAKKATR